MASSTEALLIRPDAGARAAAPGFARAEPVPASLRLVYAMWVVLLLEPEWWLATFGAGPLKRIPTLLVPILIGIALSRADLRVLYWPMGLFFVSHTITLPVVTNRGYAMDAVKYVLLFYALLVASVATIDTVRKAVPVVAIFALQFVWWGLHGLPAGGVSWHSTLSNQDGFGPVMVLGLAFAAPLALGARSRLHRAGAIGIVGLCAFGLVASFARGAVLAGGAVLLVLWLRSHRKAAMFVGILLAVGTIAIASRVLFPDGAFWTEMQTITEGFDDPTGADRRDLWWAGWEVFLRSPLVGVGPSNVGAYAAEHFAFGDARGFYEDPAHLYGRSLHNIYVQLLAEQGLVGVVLFLVILLDFFRRNRALRMPAAIARWSEGTAGQTDLRAISLGLEAAMAGYLVSSVFYDQLYSSALYSLVALNLVLWSVTAPPDGPRRAGRP
jgi:O-antigen ligase